VHEVGGDDQEREDPERGEVHPEANDDHHASGDDPDSGERSAPEAERLFTRVLGRHLTSRKMEEDA
jgi:hypothetical protein